jgi:hypothetical protein
VTLVLSGPYPFDEKTVTASARGALAVVVGALRAGEGAALVAGAATGQEPGLYILLDTAAEPLIAGFWVVAGSSFTEKGPAGPPDREPPFAQELLDATVEEVWWKDLPVNKGKNGVWRPLVVVEWPHFLASRSALAPPGVALPFLDETFEEDGDATWLDEVTADLPLSATEVEVEFEDDEFGGGGAAASRGYDDLPVERSVIAIVRGYLEKGRAIHKGEFVLLPFEGLGRAGVVVPFEEWSVAAASPETKGLNDTAGADDAPRLGTPLGLPGGRVGFQALGWLTRNLEVWPQRASAIRKGLLSDRVVQSRWKGQLAMALSSSVIVLTLVISVAMGIRQAATPRPEASPEPPPPAAQPAMAQCSAEHTQFVEEFRCQVAALAAGGRDALGNGVCEDRSDEVRDLARPSTSEDLQAAYCGLLDRAEQNWIAKFGLTDDAPKANWAEFAAAQACFNVLGHPYPYELMTYGERKVANPAKFLEDENLRVEPLMQLVTDLRAACSAYRDRTEARVEGAIFATHVGDSRGRIGSNRKSLRELATDYALVGVPDELAQCFREGMDQGLSAVEYHRMCTSGRGPNDSADRDYAQLLIWQKLAGDHLTVVEGSGDVIGRYARARFGYGGDDPNSTDDDGATGRFVEGQVARSNEVWQCHMSLSGRYAPGRPPEGPGLGQWEIRLPMPTSYGVEGVGARSQLQLDAGLLSMREGLLSAGTCWSVVARRLTQYTPIHPLIAQPDSKGWPSDEQQLCGQICAAYYGITKVAVEDQWATPYGDLDACVTRARPIQDATERSRLGRGDLDQLRIPYHSVAVSTTSFRWVDPDHADVCAFNLVAQNLMPADEGGYIVGGRASEEWAGETSDGSRIAGDPGKWIRWVRTSYRPGAGGDTSGVNACGDVATQCFTSLMLEVINPRLEGDDRRQRYEYEDRWTALVREVAGQTEAVIREGNPWCAAIYPYLLPPQGGQRSGATELDAPCRSGVEEARGKALSAIRHIATDNIVVERP